MNEIVTRMAPPAPPTPAITTPMEMISRAIENGVNIDVLDKLMTLQERWEANQGRKAFDHAISAAKAELPAIVKNQTASRGNAGSYKYEDLAQIAAQIDPILGKHGLSYRFRTKTEGKKLFVTCIVSHRDGYSEETTLEGEADTSGAKNPIQATGSAITYLQRYTLKAALGLAAAKDDDNDAPKAKAEPMSADDFLILRERIEAQGEAAGKVEDFMLSRFGTDTLDVLTRQQMQEALAMIRKRENAQKGTA